MVETPVAYKSTFKISELEKVKLEQSFEDGTKVKMEVPLFTGQQGLEGLVYIVDRFKDACKALDWVEGNEMFEGFSKVLKCQAYSYWVDEILSKYPGEDQSPDTFKHAVDMMKISFGGGTLARNHILQYILTNDCKKPRKSTVEEHVRRITNLVSLANQSAGTDAEVTKVKLNELLLATMPSQWQQNFKLSGHTISDMTTDKFIMYFSEVKDVHDSEQQPGKNNQNKGMTGRFARGFGRGGGRFNRGGGRFMSNRGGRNGRFSSWGSRNSSFRGRGYLPYNNFFRGNGGNQQGGRNNGGRNFYRTTGRNINTTGGRFTNNRSTNQEGNNRHVYWNDSNWNTLNNPENNGNNPNTETQENRIVEVNHWELLNNNAETWDRTKYGYYPSQGK